MGSIQEIFEGQGGEFVTPFSAIQKRLSVVKAFVFDWDGVFNNGAKSSGYHAPFSEADSMGINLLRFDFWCRHQGLPLVYIVTGEDNPTAIYFAQRENFHAVYQQIKDKSQAIQHICDRHNITAAEIACFWDDVTDLSMAKLCGLRIMLRRSASPLFEGFARKAGLCDYITGHSGDRHGLREASELIIGMQGMYDERITARYMFDTSYQQYFELRKKMYPAFFQWREGMQEYFL